MDRAPGRNDPCPCGSGRKYKHCCLKAADTADFLWRQLRSAEGRLVPELFKRAISTYGAPFFHAALAEFFVWDGVPDNYEEADDFGTFFVPWWVFSFVADPHDPDGPKNAPDEPLAAIYLREHRDDLSPIECAFLEAALASPMSFYAVTRTIPGREIHLHDVLTGTDIVVQERSASNTVSPGGLLFTRVVTAGDVSIMVGYSSLLIPPSWHNTIIDFRAHLAPNRRKLTREQLLDFDIEMREQYFHIEDAVYNPPPPKIRNTDGEPLVLTVLQFALRCSPQSAFDRLKPLAHESDSELLMSEAVFDPSGALQSVSLPWIKKGNRLHKDWENTTLGHLQIAGDHLEAHVNSKPRATRIQREIAKRLGADVILQHTQADKVEELLEKRRGQPIDPVAEDVQEQLQQQPEVQAFMQAAAAKHWKAWLDQKIPALGDRTPRQAARLKEGRERLEALLAHYAWEGERKPNAFSPDIPALRLTLGLPAV